MNILLIIEVLASIFYSYFTSEISLSSYSILPLNQSIGATFSIILGLIIGIISLFVWIRFARREKFFEESQLPLISLLLLLISLSPSYFLSLENVFSLLFIIFLLMALLLINKQKVILYQLFIASAALGVSIIFYPPALIFIPFLWFSMYILRPFEGRNFAITIVGLLLPFFYLYGFAYLFNLNFNSFEINLNPTLLLQHTTTVHVISYLILALVIIASIMQTFSGRIKMVSHRRNQIRILLIFAILCCVLAFFDSHAKQAVIYFSLPIVLFYNHLHSRSKRYWLLDLLLLIVSSALLYDKLFAVIPTI